MSDANAIANILEEGIALAKAGHKEDARRLLMQVIEQDEQNDKAWLWLSGIVDSSEEKRICLENVLAINPDNPHARAGLQWIEEQEAEAQEETGTIPTAGPDRCPNCQSPVSQSAATCPECGTALIVACPSCGRYVDVIEQTCPDCGQVLGDFRAGAAYHLNLAHQYLAHHRPDRAQAALANATALDDDDPALLAEMAELYDQTGQAHLALEFLQKAIERIPKEARLHAILGALYRNQSQPDLAREAYKTAARLSNDDPEILTELARLHLQDGNTRDASILLNRAIRADSKSPATHLVMGDLYMAQDQQKRAFKHYESAFKFSAPESDLQAEASRKLATLQTALDLESVMKPRFRPQGRPGCLTIYAILLALNGFMGLGASAFLVFGLNYVDDLLTLAEMPAMYADQLSGILWIVVGSTLVSSLLTLIIAMGLWNLKNWARIVVLVLLIISFVAGFAQAAFGVVSFQAFSSGMGAEGVPIMILAGFLIGFLVQGYMIFWFIANADLFA